MKVLFDQGTPAPLRHHLPGHTVATAYEAGWDKLENGQLLQAAEANGFGILVTTDTPGGDRAGHRRRTER